MSADGNQHCIEPLVEQVVQVVDASIEPEIHTQVDDILDFPLDNGSRQAVFRNAESQHSSGNRHGFKDCDPVSCSHQVLGSGQAARTRTDDSNTAVEFRLDCSNRLARLRIYLVGDETLEGADIDGLIDQATIAGRLTAVIADAPAYARERVVHFDDAHGIVPAPLSDQGNIPLGALPRRTGIAASRNTAFLDGEGVRDGLRIKLEDRPAIYSPVLGALTTASRDFH